MKYFIILTIILTDTNLIYLFVDFIFTMIVSTCNQFVDVYFTFNVLFNLKMYLGNFWYGKTCAPYQTKLNVNWDWLDFWRLNNNSRNRKQTFVQKTHAWHMRKEVHEYLYMCDKSDWRQRKHIERKSTNPFLMFVHLCAFSITFTNEKHQFICLNVYWFCFKCSKNFNRNSITFLYTCHNQLCFGNNIEEKLIYVKKLWKTPIFHERCRYIQK